jgi:hypothetical protein
LDYEAVLNINIQLSIPAKLVDLERQVRDLQQTYILYGVGASHQGHRLQFIWEAIEDTQAHR